MKTPEGEAKITARKMMGAVLISLGCGVSAGVLWFIALLTAYSSERAWELVLRQAIWLIPASLILCVPLLLVLPSRKG